METICGECPAEKNGCLIKFIEDVRHICICRNCLVKPMCKRQCEDRETLFINLPEWIRRYLDEIHHYHAYNGVKEYNRLMKDLEASIIRYKNGFR